MYKKFKVIKPGVFFQPIQQHGAAIKRPVPIPVGSIIQLMEGEGRMKTHLYFRQIELVADDTPVTFGQ